MKWNKHSLSRVDIMSIKMKNVDSEWFPGKSKPIPKKSGHHVKHEQNTMWQLLILWNSLNHLVKTSTRITYFNIDFCICFFWKLCYQHCSKKQGHKQKNTWLDLTWHIAVQHPTVYLVMDDSITWGYDRTSLELLIQFATNIYIFFCFDKKYINMG